MILWSFPLVVSNKRRGDGLGLSISRKIARQMGGDIIVESNINEGATFILSLPLKQVAKTDVVEPKGLDIPVENFKKINVLVVEDSITNREVLCDMLEGMGHKVIECNEWIGILRTS